MFTSIRVEIIIAQWIEVTKTLDYQAIFSFSNIIKKNEMVKGHTIDN